MLQFIKHIPYLDLRPTISPGSSGYFYPEVILLDYNLSSRGSLLTGLTLPRCAQWIDPGFFFKRKHIMYSLKINMHFHSSVSLNQTQRILSNLYYLISIFPFPRWLRNVVVKVVCNNRNYGIYLLICFVL